MSRQSIVNVFIDLIIKTTFGHFGYNRCYVNRPIILFFVSVIILQTGVISAYFNSFGKLAASILSLKI